RIAKLFTPAVNGTFLVLMSLQLSNTIVKGLLGLSTPAPEISGKALIVSLLTAGCILVISLKAKGFIRTIGVLLGTTIGWITAIFLGIAPSLSNASHQLLSVPQIFAWGTPTLDPGIMITCLLTGIIVLSNFVASIAGMSKLLDTPDTPDLYNRGVIVTGISNILAGLGCVVGFIPYASAIGFIGLSGVASRLPFIVGSFMLAMLGLVAPIGTLLAAMPPAVGYAVLLTTFALVLGAGLKEYTYL
ncbi:MAG: purine/pyrimidine permease, partial [Clostridia bacterium]|nr:purine/pyrimidine permease [Clostridia bacterium]